MKTSRVRVSKWWLAVGTVCGLLAAGTSIAAVVHQQASSRPIGEGEVFANDVIEVAGILESGPTMDEAVRHARNALDVESVSVVDGDGIIAASTSSTMSGQTLTNPLLERSVAEHRLAALATPTDLPVQIDGVVEWPAGSVLYQVVAPGPDPDQSVLLQYDISELLERRAQPGVIQPETIQLLALAFVFALLGAAVVVGHMRASRRQREMEIEAELLRKHSEELEATNAELAEARRAAERALGLAEEKMRIRSDFVLMINHELRTPLTTVVTGAELLANGEIPSEDQAAMLGQIVTDARRLEEIIDQILAVARIENRGLFYDLVEVPLSEVCTATGIEVASLPARDDDDTSREWMVRTDVGALNLVVASLANNAVSHGASEVHTRYATSPLIEPMVEVGRRPSNAVYFVVEDDGPGIDPHFLPQAFEKFEKQSRRSGTGLGLYMARLVIEALDGSIAVSTSPSGTTFQIAVPGFARSRVKETV